MNDESDFRERLRDIERLTQEVEKLPDAKARETCVELIRLLMEYHGAAIERVMEFIAADDARARLFNALAEDELATSVLLLYGLHPSSLETRVARALEKIQPYLQSQSSGAEIISIDDGVISLRLSNSGGCGGGCQSTAAKLTRTVENAIYEAAPDAVAVQIEEENAARSNSGLVQIQSHRATVTA